MRIFLSYWYLYIYKVVITVFLSKCLFVRSLLRNPWTELPQILIREIGRTTGMFFVWFWDSKLSGSTLIAKIFFTGKIVQFRINGGSNYDHPMQSWVSRLVIYNIDILHLKIQTHSFLEQTNPHLLIFNIYHNRLYYINNFLPSSLTQIFP